LNDNTSDSDILELMGITIDGLQTLSGIMLFSKYPQGYFPQLCITAVVVPGTEMGDTGDDGERFIDNKRMTGNISEMLCDAVDFVRRNSRVKTIIDDDGKRSDKSEFPIKAVREAILNALVHRDYSIHTENVPVRLTIFSNRMEIINSGGLFGRISIDSLGKIRPETRNPAMANILELLHETENRYSGIPTIRKELSAAGLPDPVFEVKRGEFIVTFNNNNSHLSNEKKRSPNAELLKYCRTPRSRQEIIEFVGFSRYYTMDTIIKPLIELGKLKMTLPDKPKSSNQKYYTN
jgi:ATP-dependent DNA helicase RecG